MSGQRILVLGIGNLLMGDEGVGVHAARRIAAESLPPEVTVVDGGTGGFHLLSCFQDYDVLIMIDAVQDGRVPARSSSRRRSRRRCPGSVRRSGI